MSSLAHITSPCGHTAPFDDVVIARDRFLCPVCRLAWYIETAPPVRYPSGWVHPGARTVHTLPHPIDVAARRALEKEPPAPLERVLAQAAASNRHRAAGAAS